MYRCGGSNNAMVFPIPYEGESPISSVVDCTLSLGTPATRLTGDYDRVNERRSSGNWSANLCWDILQSSAPSQKTNRGGANGVTAVVETVPVAARRCANCDTTSTPLWRNGPRGPKVILHGIKNSRWLQRTIFLVINDIL